MAGRSAKGPPVGDGLGRTLSTPSMHLQISKSEDTVASRALTEEERIPAFEMAVQAIATERNMLCPANQPLTVDDIEAECCIMAIVTEHEEHFRFRLKFTLVDGSVYDVRFRAHRDRLGATPIVESIQPPPCGGSAKKMQDSFENLDLRTEVIRTARSAIDRRLQTECGGALLNGSFIGVHEVHFAQSMIVEGLNLRLVVSLAEQGQALHHIQARFDLNGTLESMVWPILVEDVGLCGLIGKSSMDPAQMDEIKSLSADPSIQSHGAAASHYFRRVGGHIKELDGTVELAPAEKLASLLQRAQMDPPNRSSYDVRKAYPNCFTGHEVRSQGSCGSCWLFAAGGVLADRHCMARPDLFNHGGKRVTLSAQQALSCHLRDGCDGGHASKLFQWMLKENVYLTYEHHYPYETRCFLDTQGVTENLGDNPAGCWRYARYEDRDPSKPCVCVEQHKRPTEQPPCLSDLAANGMFGLQSFRRLPHIGERKNLWKDGRYTLEEVNHILMQALIDEGPLYVSLEVYEDWSPFVTATGGKGVYKWNGTAKGEGSHAVTMLGWGIRDETTPYWVLRNSWGERWGDRGHYLHYRGANDCGIEGGAVGPEVGNAVRDLGRDAGHRANAPIELFGETAFIEMERRDGVRGVLGHEKTYWAMQVNCTKPCRPLFAVLPTVSQGDVMQRGAAECCCDVENFDPPKCMWVPYQRLARGIASMFSKSACSTYNFGRGMTKSVRLTSISGDESHCGDDIYGGSKAANNYALESVQLTSSSFVVKLRLKSDHIPLGQHELFLRVEKFHKTTTRVPSSHTSEEVQQLYQIQLSKTEGGPISRLFQLDAVHFYFHRREEPTKVRTFFGDQWSTVTHYDLRVVAQCTGPCDGKAFFLDLDTSHHPEGNAAPQLTKVQHASSPQSLQFEKDVEKMRPGKYKIKVQAIELSSSGHKIASGSARNTQILDIEIPSLSEDQGLEWRRLQVVAPEITLDAAAWGHRCKWRNCGAVRFRCSKECALAATSYVTAAGEFPISNIAKGKHEKGGAWHHHTLLFEWPADIAHYIREFTFQVADTRGYSKQLRVPMPSESSAIGRLGEGLSKFFGDYFRNFTA